MKAVRAYSTRVEADIARMELEAAGVPSVVVGVDFTLEGGLFGVRLLVPEEYLDDALKILEPKT